MGLGLVLKLLQESRGIFLMPIVPCLGCHQGDGTSIPCAQGSGSESLSSRGFFSSVCSSSETLSVCGWTAKPFLLAPLLCCHPYQVSCWELSASAHSLGLNTKQPSLLLLLAWHWRSGVLTLALNLWAFNTCRDCLSTHRQHSLSIPRLQGLVPRGSERTGCIPGRRKSIEGHELQRHCHWLGTCRRHRSLGTGETLRGNHCPLALSSWLAQQQDAGLAGPLLWSWASICTAGGHCLHLPSLGLTCPQESSNYHYPPFWP